ncbi:hypothetical protein TSMG0121 [Halocynthia phage JM-2012]|uniref:hypothetical protein n=1 Tax=Halocynthia phage JM-2012 TaxID=1173297 RepID=UPI00025C694D|nr:hypothetical protein TSMG0121 [Halocynthia phage JM-2012]AFI55404.1 hypothetical protein TSMG0121 [Halocynthia phage JM-2012]
MAKYTVVRYIEVDGERVVLKTNPAEQLFMGLEVGKPIKAGSHKGHTTFVVVEENK